MVNALQEAHFDHAIDCLLFRIPGKPTQLGGEAKEAYAFSGQGEVFSYTVMHDAPTGYDSTTPYTVAVVKLAEGPMVTAQLTDLGEKPVEIGMPVEMVTRRIREDGSERGILVYGYKFRPAIRAN